MDQLQQLFPKPLTVPHLSLLLMVSHKPTIVRTCRIPLEILANRVSSRSRRVERTLRQADRLDRNKVPAQAIVPLNLLTRVPLRTSPSPAVLQRRKVLSILPFVLRTARRQPTPVTRLLVPETPRPVISPLPPKTGRVNEVNVRNTNRFGPEIAIFELPA